MKNEIKKSVLVKKYQRVKIHELHEDDIYSIPENYKKFIEQYKDEIFVCDGHNWYSLEKEMRYTICLDYKSLVEIIE